MKLTNQMYEKLFSSAGIGLLLNSMEGSFVDFNQAVLDMLGYTDEELRNLSYWDLTPMEYKEQEAEQLESLQKIQSYGPYDKEYFHKKGHRINVLLHGIIVLNDDGEEHIFSTIQDISKGKKAEKVLNKAQEMGNIGHWYLDLVNNNLEWSDETYRIFGLKPQEFDATYEAFVERIYPQDRDAVNSAYTNSLEVDEPYQIEHRVIRPNGDVRYVVERCEHFHDKDGAITGSIGTVLDITDRKSIERDLLEAKNRAESSNMAKNSFIASMNHELRTPLNAIMGFSNRMVKDKSLSEQHINHLKIINSSGEHLLGIINDILDISKIEAGEMSVDYSVFNLLETIRNITDLMSFEAKSKNLECIYNYDEDVPEYVVSDKGKIKQILLNIVGNAIKFTEKGSISLSISAKKIQNKNNYAMIRIDVSDTGCGIQESMLDEVFKPFVQNDGLKKVEGGTGLGLAISKNIVSLLGGTIALESKVGRGSTFAINIPVEIAKKSDIAPLANTKETKQENIINHNIEENKEIEKLPPEIVHGILDAAKKGSGINIKKEISKIEFTHENAYRQLFNLTSKYDFDAIIRLIKENHD